MTLSVFSQDAKLIATIVVLNVGAWVFWLRPLLERRTPHESIPMIPNSHWLLGHLFWFLRKGFLEKQQALLDCADKQGRCSVWMAFIPSISLTTPSDAKQLLWNTHNRDIVPIMKYHFERLVGPKNLLMMNGKEWKYYQSALRTALSRLDPYFLQWITQETTQKLTRNLKAKIKDGGSSSIEIPSIQALMKMITMDVFGRSAFSHDFGCCSKAKLCAFAQAFEFMEEEIMSRCTKHTLLPQNLFYWIPTMRNSKFNKQRGLARGELRDMLHKRKSNQNDAKDIISKILEARAKAAAANFDRNAVDDALSEEDLIDFLLSLLLAGYETLSTALTYTLYLLSQHPEWEKRCLEEIKKVTKNHGNNSTSNQDKEFDLPICRGAIMEALRLYPVATGSSRTLKKNLTFQDGVTIPKGTHVGVSFWLIHRCEKYFPKALEFHPDRWIPNDSTENACPFGAKVPPGNLDAFFAFSGGARSCPGQHYALREATVALAWLIKDLEFSIDPSFELEIEWKAVVQGPKGGIPAKVSIRGT